MKRNRCPSSIMKRKRRQKSRKLPRKVWRDERSKDFLKSTGFFLHVTNNLNHIAGLQGGTKEGDKTKKNKKKHSGTH